MESRERDELRENDLEHFLFHINEWWSKHGTRVLVGVLVVLVVIAGYRFWRASQIQAHDEAWRDVAATTSPEGLRNVAADHSDPAVKAVALLGSADLLCHQAVTPGSNLVGTREDALTEAQNAYQAVIDHPQVHAVYKYNAKLGLAAVAEAREDFDAAAAIYREVIEQATAYRDIVTQAKERLEMLGRLREPVVFAPETPEAEASSDPLPSMDAGIDLNAQSADEAPASEPEPAATDAAPASESTAPAEDAATPATP